MRKKLLLFLLLITILVSAFSLKEILCRPVFSAKKDIETITYLSSDHFKGRMPGTLENTEAAEYIKTQFKSIGLETFDNDSYYQTFDCIYPKKIEGEPTLCVYDKNKSLIKTYEYGQDYIDDNCCYSVNENDFTAGECNVSKQDNLMFLSAPKGNMVIVDASKNNFDFRSSFFADSQYNMIICARNNIISEIDNYLSDGNTIHVFIPYKHTSTTINNVIGVIKGSDESLPPVVIGAHFDHVGIRLDNVVYNGALDNASGTAFMLELARYMKSLGTPKRDIIFAAFNGEDSGLLGSKAFAQKYRSKLKDADVFNFDMIGSDEGIPLCIMDGQSGQQSDKLVAEVTSICKENNILYNCVFEDSSDHASFNSIGVNAITFCDDDRTRIHTPDDKAEYIKASAIERCYSVMEPEIESFDFSKYHIYKYSTIIFVCSTASSLVIAAVLVIEIKKNKKQTSKVI